MRRAWFTIGGVLAVSAIVLAVLMALAQLLLPLVAHYPERVARMLSEQLHQPVSFASIEGHWQPSGPLLVLHKVHIGTSQGQAAMTLPTARVKLDFGALVWPSRHWVNLRLSGLKLRLVRDADGHWHVAGFGVAGTAPTRNIRPSDLPGNLWLDDLQLEIDDAGSGNRYRIRAGPVRVSNGADALRFAGLLHRGNSRQALKIVGDIRGDGTSGRLYLSADDVDLGSMFANAKIRDYAIDSGRGDLAVWLAWQHRKVTGLVAQADLSDLSVQGPGGPVSVADLKGLMRYKRRGDHATVLFAPGEAGAARVDISGLGGDDERIVGTAHDLTPGGWLTLAALAPKMAAGTRDWLINAHPQVHLSDANFTWSQARRIESLQVRFDHLGFAATAGQPGVDHLHGMLLGDAEAMSLHLPKQSLTLDDRPMFRWPFELDVHGDAAFWRSADGWHLGTDGIGFTGKGIKGSVRGSILLPVGGGAPVLDLYAGLDHLDIAEAKRFWPVTAMAQSAIDWLDKGLIAGSVDDARVVMHGDLSDWPFKHHEGRFQASADISGLALDFQPGWPRAENLSVKADFIDNGMLAVLTSGQVQGVKVKHAVASIPDFGKSELVLTAQGGGKGGDLLQFVRSSPIGKTHADVLKHLQMNGEGDFDFSMVVPLSRKATNPFTLAGTVNLHDADVDAADWKLHLGHLSGPLKFDRHGLDARGLTATYHGQPVTLDMNIGPGTGNPAWPFKVNMRGNFTMAQLVAGHDEVASLAGIASGSAPFDIGFHIDNDADNPVHAKQVLSVHSNLRGMALKLPAPLDKSTQALLPLNMQMGFPFAGGHLRVVLGNQVYARARLPSDKQPAVVDVMLGGTAPQGPLPAQGIHIRGRTPRLDVSGWVQYALSAKGDAKQQDVPPINVDVMTGKSSVFGHEFKDLHVKIHPEKNDLKLTVEGPEIKGNTTVPLQNMDKRGVVARFDRLYWPSPDKVDASGKSSKPVARPVSPTPQEAADVGVAPASLPPLHVWVGDLRFGDAHLGQVRLESRPTAQGMHIDMLRTQSKSVHISATGAWTGTARDSHTHMELHFSAENLGRMLDAFGYDGLFSGGETQVDMNATWPGAPSSFTLANVEGTLTLDIGQGRIPEVKPGVGRLFGLMSIAELPRRLSLDFGDVFGKGFGFDSIKGHFRFHDGNAYTEDLKLEGPAADVSVTGRVGFRKHDYDQHVLAIPHIGNSLPIVGAVVGGPVGAAAGLAVQGLLGKGINKAASARYHITGSWDDPKIELVEKHGAKKVPRSGQSAAKGGAPVSPKKTTPAVSGSVQTIPVPASTTRSASSQP